MTYKERKYNKRGIQDCNDNSLYYIKGRDILGKIYLPFNQEKARKT